MGVATLRRYKGRNKTTNEDLIPKDEEMEVVEEVKKPKGKSTKTKGKA